MSKTLARLICDGIVLNGQEEHGGEWLVTDPATGVEYTGRWLKDGTIVMKPTMKGKARRFAIVITEKP